MRIFRCEGHSQRAHAQKDQACIFMFCLQIDFDAVYDLEACMMGLLQHVYIKAVGLNGLELTSP